LRIIPKVLKATKSIPLKAVNSSINQGENGAWTAIKGTWKPLHGSIAQGCSIEWHDFFIEKEMDWGRSFHPGSLEICLNFAGNGYFDDAGVERSIGPNQIALYTLDEKLKAGRAANSMHRFLTVELSREFLRSYFGDQLHLLKEPIRNFVSGEEKALPFIEIKPLPSVFLAARLQFVEPPVPRAAQKTWYLGRVLEILAQTLFIEEDPGELFCHKHQRTNQERIDRVRFLIERDLENPPSLGMLAEEVGCSTYYLSRIFVQIAGVSIPQFLRMKRIERAAELISKGRMNVTEAAMAVGYSSLSAFTKAFVDQMGCCPGLYPIRVAAPEQIA